MPPAALIGSLAVLGDHLPQLLRQLGGWIEAEGKAGRLLVGGEPMGNTATGLTAAASLNDAGVVAAGLGLLLHDVQNALSIVTAPETEGLAPTRGELGGT